MAKKVTPKKKEMKEFIIQGWIPAEETLHDTAKIARHEIKRTEIFSDSFKLAQDESKHFKAKKAFIRLVITHKKGGDTVAKGKEKPKKAVKKGSCKKMGM